MSGGFRVLRPLGAHLLLQHLVIAPNQTKHLRRRYGAAGNKDDRFAKDRG
ncbi:hypothetical protein ONA70_10440 [Micromonospora yasonensis]|nr:hypothetical protein [Micromonospora yasonensis]MCW3840513.1 hypothetical protein [Micromonospora yasonensis]